MKITTRYTNVVIFENDSETIREAVIAAIAAKTNLSGANLRNANLRNADLSYANLSDANLRNADLRFLRSANGKELACINAGKYQVVLSKEKIAIGCKFFTVEEWKEFDDDKISKMDDGSLEWWRQWKELVFMFHKNVFG